MQFETIEKGVSLERRGEEKSKLHRELFSRDVYSTIKEFLAADQNICDTCAQRGQSDTHVSTIINLDVQRVSH